MSFKCPRCGYPNKINLKCKYEACGIHLNEMDDFVNIETFLQELTAKDRKNIYLF